VGKGTGPFDEAKCAIVNLHVDDEQCRSINEGAYCYVLLARYTTRVNHLVLALPSGKCSL